MMVNKNILKLLQALTNAQLQKTKTIEPRQETETCDWSHVLDVIYNVYVFGTVCVDITHVCTFGTGFLFHCSNTYFLVNAT